MSTLSISAGRIARFGKDPLQIHFVDTLTECERQQMPPATKDSDPIATGGRVKNKLGAGDAGNATSCDQQ